MKQRLKITDDSGFMGIVNAATYKSYVDADWELPQLLNHFLQEMNENNLLIWSTGTENYWAVDILEKPSGDLSYREFSKIIEVTNDGLYLTNYEDLSSAAQFMDEVIPSHHNSDLYIKLDNGLYNVTVRQMSDPDEYLNDNENADFEISFEKVNIKKKHETETTKIFWLDQSV